MCRIWIRGTSGSGKTTLARAVAARLGIPAFDLDDLYWLPGWTGRPHEEFRALVAAAAAEPSWVIAGNYSKVTDLLEPQARLAIWLDYPVHVTFGRVLRRTAVRCITRERCCNGNRESFWKSFFTPRSVIWWSLTTHRRRHEDCDRFMAAERPGQTRIRHRGPGETARWLTSLSNFRLFENNDRTETQSGSSLPS